MTFGRLGQEDHVLVLVTISKSYVYFKTGIFMQTYISMNHEQAGL